MHIKWYILISAIAAAILWSLITMPAKAACSYSWCASKTHKLLDKNGRKRGDIYVPGHGRRPQIRDNDRRIQGYLRSDGTIVDLLGRKIGRIK